MANTGRKMGDVQAFKDSMTTVSFRTSRKLKQHLINVATDEGLTVSELILRIIEYSNDFKHLKTAENGELEPKPVKPVKNDEPVELTQRELTAVLNKQHMKDVEAWENKYSGIERANGKCSPKPKKLTYVR